MRASRSDERCRRVPRGGTQRELPVGAKLPSSDLSCGRHVPRRGGMAMPRCGSPETLFFLRSLARCQIPHRPQDFEHVFASIQSLAANSMANFPAGHFDMVIVDEFHHAAAQSYRSLAFVLAVVPRHQDQPKRVRRHHLVIGGRLTTRGFFCKPGRRQGHKQGDRNGDDTKIAASHRLSTTNDEHQAYRTVADGSTGFE